MDSNTALTSSNTICCPCSRSPNRCLTDQCPCFSSRKLCQSRCETDWLMSDCLNQTYTNCKCTGAHGQLCKTKSCECFAMHDQCSSDCSCRKQCARKLPELAHSADQRPTVISCKCSGSKKSCSKTKCACRMLLEACGSSKCKCQGQCTNSPNQSLSHQAKLAFTFPHGNSETVFVRLLGNDYKYDLEFISQKDIHAVEQCYETLRETMRKFKLPITEILLYTSLSPCYHQFCEPQCDILEECESHRSCAKLLCVMLKQTQRVLQNSQIKMTVKILAPNTSRGDLYTKQGLICLLESGISVEPITEHDWCKLLHDPKEPVPLHSIWESEMMTRYVRQIQHYINQCSNTLQLSERYWISNLHQMLKNSVVAMGNLDIHLEALAKELNQKPNGAEMLSSTDSLAFSSLILHQDDLMSSSKNSTVQKGTFMKRRRYSNRSKSIEELNTYSNKKNVQATTQNSVQPFLPDDQMQNDTVEKILLELSGRGISKNDIDRFKTDVLQATEDMQKQISGFFQLLLISRSADFEQRRQLRNGRPTTL